MLSLKIVIGLDINSFSRFRFLNMFRMYVNSLTHSSVAYISASAELLAVIDCLLDCQCRGPKKKMMWPEMERDLKSGSW